jgi:pyrroloquinoline-quinone synthase
LPTDGEFFRLLDCRIAPYNLLKHPFYEAWTAGDLTQDDLREYAAEYWHHVSAFPSYLSALHSRLADSDLRRTVLHNLADEEGFAAPDRRPHSDLWMDFACGMGAHEADVRGREIQPETQALIQAFRELMQQGNSAALAALYAYESQIPEIATQKAAGLREHYGAGDADCRYFDLHRTADIHHARVWKQALEAELSNNPEVTGQAADEAFNAAEAAAKALWGALDGIERQRKERRAN